MWGSKDQSKASADAALSSDSGVSPGDKTEAIVRRPTLVRWLDHVRHWLEIVWRHPIITGGLVVMLSGSALATLDVTDVYFSSENFCATTCHAMRSTVYPELQQSKHWTTPTGVRPTCATCHVSGRLTLAMWDHFVSTTDLITQLTNDMSAPDSFEKFRPAAAEKVRLDMLENDSKNCHRCHVMEAIQPKLNRGKKLHAEAIKTGATCIECHYNLVHKDVPASQKFLDAIEAKYKEKK